MASKWLEMFEDENGLVSSSNVGFLLTVACLCFCLVFAAICKDDGETLSMAGVLAGMTGTTKIWNKVSGDSVKKASMNPAPVPLPPLAALGPTTIINAGSETKPQN